MLSRREEALLRGLTQRKNREREGLFVVEGVRAVEDLLASPLRVRFIASSLEDAGRAGALLRMIEEMGIELRRVEAPVLAGYADTEAPQGVLAVAEIPRRTLDDLPVAADRAVLLVLDAVQDPGNFGTLVRTAEALGAAALVSLPGTVDAWNPKSVRAAMGSSFRLPIVDAAWETLAPWLADRRIPVLVSRVGAPPLDGAVGRAALVLGNEGAGVSERSCAHAEREVGIPLRGRAESLNVAAAGAILLHDLLR